MAIATRAPRSRPPSAASLASEGRRPRLRRMLAVGPRCPDCGGPLVFGEGCQLCPICGYSACGGPVRS